MSCAHTFFPRRCMCFPALSVSDSLRNLAPQFTPIRSEIETTRDLLAGNFPRSAPATSITIELWLVDLIYLSARVKICYKAVAPLKYNNKLKYIYHQLRCHFLTVISSSGCSFGLSASSRQNRQETLSRQFLNQSELNLFFFAYSRFRRLIGTLRSNDATATRTSLKK